MTKPRVRVKATGLMYLAGTVPDDARPGDLIVGNRGAAARVIRPPSQWGGLAKALTLEYVGNYFNGVRPDEGRKLYNRSGLELPT